MTAIIKLILSTLFLFNLFNLSLTLTLDSTGYLGCYASSAYLGTNINMAFASHLDPTQLKPYSCYRACSAVQYGLAFIINGDMCFCQKSHVIQLVRTGDANCSSVSCPGDANYACGGLGFLMAYEAGESTNLTSILTQPSNSGGVPLFTQLTDNYTYTGQPQYFYLLEDRVLTRTDLQVNDTGSVFTQCLTNTGVKTYEHVIASTSLNSFESSRKAILTPTVYDPIGNLSMTCPSLISDMDVLRCKITFTNGSNLAATITYGTTPDDVFNLADFDTINYGIPVPKTLPNYVPQNLSLSTVYVAANAEILADGYLKGIEIYAETTGTVNLLVVQPSQAAGNSPNNMDYSIVASSLSTTYTCTSSKFLRSNSNCALVSKATRFNSYLSASSFTNVTIAQASVTLNQGYNLITASNLGIPDYKLQTGQLIFVEFVTGQVAVDTSGNGVLTDYMFQSGGFSAIKSGSVWRLYVNVIVSPLNKELSTFRNYTSAGVYSVTATVKNILSPSNTLTVSQSVTVQKVITSLSVTAGAGSVCFTALPCSISATSTGSDIFYYNWTISGNGTTNVTTSTTSNILYQFKDAGTFTIVVFACNNVSSAYANVTVTALDKIDGLSFKSGTLANSSSIVGQNAQFLFILMVGQLYSCLTDFGDGSTTNITDAVASPNNTKILHLYSQERAYNVSINCSSPVNSLSLSFTHFVQYPLTGLQLSQNGTTIGNAYRVGFSLQSGSVPNVLSFYFDGSLDSGVAYSNLVGQSSNHVAEYTPTIHYIYIYMSNYVSTISLNGTYQISTSIVKPSFNVTPVANISSYTYLFPMTLTFFVSMASGSNVRIDMNMDSLNQPSTLSNLTVSVQTTGAWVPYSPYTIPYVYENPGHFTINANISNSLNLYTFNQAVVLMTKVDDLIPQLLNTNTNYVVFDTTQNQALAQFIFRYAGSSKAGSDAYVTFWPGDATNSSNGPYPLNMDFNANISRAALQYTYSSVGTYQVSFFVTNSLGSKWFTLSVQVVIGMSGFYMSVSPLNAQVGSTVNVMAYLIQGTNVTYKWLCNGTTFATGPRTSTTYSTPDSRSLVMTSAGNYTLEVDATDLFLTIPKTYVLEVQSAITALTASVNPSTPQTNIDTVPSTRTFTFTIALTPSNPTNVYYTIDFGDGSNVNLPAYYASNPTQITYTYASCNVYSVNITVFNKVSSFSQILTASIFSNFIGLTCKPYWRQFPTDTSPDNAYTLTNGSYYVYQQYDVRFYCTWLRLDAIPTQFNIYYNGTLKMTITNIAGLTKISGTSYVGYIVPYNQTFLTDSGIVSIESINPIYTQSDSSWITPIAAISSISWVSQSTALDSSSMQVYQIKYGSLGSPSCSLISYKSGYNTTTIVGLIGTSSATCTSIYPAYASSLSTLYFGDYSTMASGGVLTFNTTKINKIGNNQLVVNVANSQGSVTATTNMTFVSQAQMSTCNLPQVDIYNKSVIFYQPVVFTRSQMIVLSSNTVLNCSAGLGNNKQWTIYTASQTTGTQQSKVTITNNPTVNYDQLVLQPATLSYNLYKVMFQATMTFNSIYTSTAYSYIKIQPSGLVVLAVYGAVGGGTYQMAMGYSQTLTLDPRSYSYDLDSIANMNSLNFTFYCQVIDNGVAYGYPAVYYNNDLDLYSMKTGYSSSSDIQNLYNTNNTQHSCFTSINQFSFDSTGNVLTISSGGLSYVPNRIYEFYATTNYYGTDYYQYVQIVVQPVNAVPLLSMSCKLTGTCKPYGSYVKVNPNTVLVIDGSCYDGCTQLLNFQYNYNVYQSWSLNPTDNQIIWFYYDNNTEILGDSTQELTLQPAMFLNNPTILQWKIEFTLTAITPTNGIATGLSSMIILVNQLPYGGSCSVSPTTGITFNTTFIFSCTNWDDHDGEVASYSFYGYSLNNKALAMGFGTSLDGSLSVQLPEGSATDNYNTYIYVNIVDNDNGVTTYEFAIPIQVKPNSDMLADITSQLLDPNGGGSILTSLYSGNSQLATQTLLTISAALNNVNTTGLNTSSQAYTDLVNNQAAVRDFLATFINNISISDLDSIIQQSAMLYQLSSATDQITRNTADSITNQCIRLITAIDNLPTGTSLQGIQTAATSLTGTLGNVIAGLSNVLNSRQDTLNLDYDRSVEPPAYYDTDLEDYWTNPNHFIGTNGTTEEYNQNKNLAQQQFLNVDVSQKVDTLTSLITGLVADNYAAGQTFQIATPSISMNIQKLQASDLPPVLNVSNALIKLPSFCSLLTNTQAITTTTTKSPYVSLSDSNNCTNRIITLKSILLPMAQSGFNSRNESRTGYSYGLDLSFLDENKNVVVIENIPSPIDMYIPRDTGLPNNAYLYVNTSAVSLNETVQLLLNSLTISAKNASLHVQIKPVNASVSYLFILKLGSSPQLGIQGQSFDYWKILCAYSSDYVSANDTSTNTMDYYYSIFLSQSFINGFQGFVGYGLRELSTAEFNSFCSGSMPSSPPLYSSNQTNYTFSSDFKIKSYSSGCYFYSTTTGKWSNYGTNIMEDTSLAYTHCQTYHLTQFAGGLVIMPNRINFSYVLANASPLNSPVIYAVCIVCMFFYIFFLIWAIWKDRQDEKRLEIILLEDNLFGDNYCYEITVFTGSRKESATDSKVWIMLNGDYEETYERMLDCKKRPIFRNGGVDSFLMTVNRPLGNLNYIRIWHDNSGQGNMASWYLKFIIVHDLQTREKFYFGCNNWLAVEKADGKIDRTLPVAGKKQEREIKMHANSTMADRHLWLSIFSRPLYSPLTRVDRVACSFFMLYVFMLANIIYYDVSDSANKGGIVFGPFSFNTDQLAVSVMTNLMLLPPLILFIVIFKRSKLRVTKSRKLRRAIDENMKIIRIDDNNFNFSDIEEVRANSAIPYEDDDMMLDKEGIIKQDFQRYMRREDSAALRKQNSLQDQNGGQRKPPQVQQKPPPKKILLPWWSRIIGHILCNLAIIAAAAFIVFEGIQFGDEKVKRWLASLFISFLTSLLLCQPIQVVIFAFLFRLVFKNSSSNLDMEQEHDHEDKGKSLNKYYRFENYKPGKLNPFKLNTFEHNHLNQGEIDAARNERIREVRIWQALQEISIYIIFICILFYITYTNIGTSAFDYQRSMKTMFNLKKDISSVSEVWDWLINTMATNLRANTWYNGGQPYNLAGYIDDFASRMIGYGWVRQIRVGNNSCSVPYNSMFGIGFCNSDLSLFNSDDKDYGFGWSTYNASYVPPWGTSGIYSAFQYQTASELEGYPFTGDYTTYQGDGYVYELRGSMKFLQGNLSQLQQLGWIDRQTRAIFVEFSTYNPNINMLMVATMLIEFLPTGTFLTLSRFDPLNLFNEINGSGTTFKIVVYFIYIGFIIYSMVVEIIELSKLGLRRYLSHFWNYVEWLLILGSWTAFALFFYRLSQAYEVLDFFEKTSGYGHKKLQIVSFWNQMLTVALGACCVFATLKLLKLFRFYKKIYALALTLRYCISELLGFGLMFVFVWVAFVQMLYLYFYDKLESYWSPLNAFTTSFECLVGKFDKNLNLSLAYTFGPIIFTIYPIVMAFMMINIFITIVCEAFKVVRFEIRRDGDELKMYDYFSRRVKNYTSDPNDRTRVANDKYVEVSQKLPKNVDRLIENLSKAYEEDIVIEKMIEETKATASKINNPDDPRRSAANSARTTPTNNKYNKNL